ncbi:phage tail tape measure protein [Enterococcus sp. DIV0086]|uniref:phage tail tape measure protein n=1 Tax=Enterococcus sp. DIV0086 TaxID=2774655 RepID=UPI003D26B3CD
MSEKISDVVLRFKTNGEVSYTKTIKAINKEMNISAAEYKNQLGAMDKNATQTEKLTATKQKLEKQLELASTRSQMLREEFEKSVAETGRYSDESQKLYKQLLDSESGEQSLKTSLESTNKELKKQGDISVETAKKIQTIEKAGEKIKGVGTKLSVGITAPIMAAKAASVKAYEDMRASQAKLINQTGKTGEEADKLKESLRNLYRNSAKSSGELADALGTVTQRFDVSGKAAEDMTTKFLTFARVNDVDAPNAIEKVSRAMGDAGIETNKYGEVLDLLTVASKKSGIEVDKLAENLTKYGAPMRALGFDTKSAIAIFATWEKAGVNTETAFAGMKKAIGTWAKEGKVPLEEFPKAMKKIEESTNPAADAAEIFGTKAGNDLGDAIKGGRFNVEEMTKALDQAGGKLDEIGGESGNPMSKMILAQHKLNDALIPFGQIIIEAMVPAVQKLAEFMGKMNEKLNGMDEGTRKTVVVIGLLLAAIGPVLVVLGSFASSISGLIPVIAFLASPIGIVIAALAAFVAGIVIAYNKVDWFRDFINTSFNVIKDIVVGVFKVLADTTKSTFDFITGFIGGAMDGAVKIISDYVNAITRIFGGIIDFVTGVFTGDWSRAWQGIVDIFGGIFDGIVAVAKAPINAMITLINGFLGGLNNIKIPKWVPGVGGKGFSIAKIPYLAEGGHMINGQAIVGEAGPELLTAKNGKTTVTPLSQDEKARGIGGALDQGKTIEQHVYFGQVDANNPSELDRLNRKIYKAAQQANAALALV